MRRKLHKKKQSKREILFKKFIIFQETEQCFQINGILLKQKQTFLIEATDSQVQPINITLCAADLKTDFKSLGWQNKNSKLIKSCAKFFDNIIIKKEND